MPTTIDCTDRSVREINVALRAAIEAGECEITLSNPEARHNLAVAVLKPVKITVDGSAGFYCAGMMDGATVEVKGSAGWGTAESMMNGTVVVHSHAGSGVGAAIRGGLIVVKGDAASRAGVSMKGGTLLIGGNCGYMAGFMMQKGRIIVCGDAGEALADSMYEGAVYVGGAIAELGNDAVIHEVPAGEADEIGALLDQYGMRAPKAFRKVLSGRKLWNFDRKELDVWKAAL